MKGTVETGILELIGLGILIFFSFQLFTGWILPLTFIVLFCSIGIFRAIQYHHTSLRDKVRREEEIERRKEEIERRKEGREMHVSEMEKRELEKAILRKQLSEEILPPTID